MIILQLHPAWTAEALARRLAGIVTGRPADAFPHDGGGHTPDRDWSLDGGNNWFLHRDELYDRDGQHGWTVTYRYDHDGYSGMTALATAVGAFVATGQGESAERRVS